MHAFKECPIEQLEMNPFTKLAKEWGLVTAGDENKCNTMTVGWGGVGVIWGKNVVYIFIRDSRYTIEFLDNGELFSLAFFEEKYRDALKYCGVHSGREGDKFAAASLTPAYKLGVPYPDEANLVLLCRKMAKVPMPESTFTDPSLKEAWYADGDMHTMYVGEIMQVLAR